jgi:hypothetical protein
MEHSLHRQLKDLYCADPGQHERSIEGYRIDAVSHGRLVEVQQAGLAAIRAKVQQLCQSHDVVVVKPLAARKVLFTRPERGRDPDKVVRRLSPRRESLWHVFVDLVHFLGVFPHPRLTLHVLLVSLEEHRVTRRTRRRRDKGYRVEDRRLIDVAGRYELSTADDLRSLLPATLPPEFTTADLAQHAGIPRWLAQKAAYCLRQTDACRIVGKSGNSLRYARPAARSRRSRAG